MPGRNLVNSPSYRNGYQGQYAEKDAETGYDAFDLRMYDANLGRWISPDPYGQFHSPYVGMGNNPVSQVDPDGGWSGFGALVGMGAGAIVGGTVGFFTASEGNRVQGAAFGAVLGATAGGALGAFGTGAIGPISSVAQNSITAGIGPIGGLHWPRRSDYPDNLFGTVWYHYDNISARMFLDFVPSPVGMANKVGKIGSVSLKLAKTALPTLDATGKVHGVLPKVADLAKYSKEELRILLKELRQSVQQRIKKTTELGRDRGHGQRQGAEQDLIKALEKYLKE